MDVQALPFVAKALKMPLVPSADRPRQAAASNVSPAPPVASAEYDSPIPLLTPPTTVHVAIVADSVNGSRGLNLPPCAQQPGCSRAS